MSECHHQHRTAQRASPVVLEVLQGEILQMTQGSARCQNMYAGSGDGRYFTGSCTGRGGFRRKTGLVFINLGCICLRFTSAESVPRG